MSEPVYPRNEFTDLIERASGIETRGPVALPPSASPPPTVRSGALGRVSPVPEAAPLSPEERAEFDAAASALGIVDGGAPAEMASGYPTMEDALRAGAPVGAELPPDRQTAREFIASREAMRAGGMRMPAASVAATPFSRMPNFSNIEGLDLTRGSIVVDGVVFPLEQRDTDRLRKWALSEVRRQVNRTLREQFSQPRKRRTRKRKASTPPSE